MCLLFVCPLVPLLQQVVIVEMLEREVSSLEIDLVKNIVSWCGLAVLKLILPINISWFGEGCAILGSNN